MNERMARTYGSVPTIPIKLSMFLATLLTFAFSIVIGAATTARADELDMNALNQQAIHTLAISKKVITKVSAGNGHSAAVTDDNELWAWGSNNHGGLDPENDDRYFVSPQMVMRDVKDVALGYYSSAVIKTDGTLWTWGWSAGGQLGNGKSLSEENHPIDQILTNVKQVTFGRYDGAAVTEDGSLYTWGKNDYGQLGDGTLVDRNKPKKIMDGVAQVTLGYDFGAALKNDGTVYTWGDNALGQLGLGHNDDRDVHYVTPQPVLNGVKKISAGFSGMAAIKNDGTLVCWGVGYFTPSLSGSDEQQIQIMTGAKDVCVSQGGGNIAVVKEDGTLITWGNNSDGQLGTGNKGDVTSYYSSDDKGILKNVAQVYLGVASQGVAVKNDGTLWSWGSSAVGDGDNEERLSPVELFLEEVIKPTESFEDTVLKTEATEYNPDLAYELIKLARAAYNGADGIASEILNNGFTVLKQDYYNIDVAPYSIGKKTLPDGTEMVLVVIRGSQEGLDFIRDFNVGLDTELLVGKHGGFYDSAQMIYSQLMNTVGIVGGDKYAITGHSQGAAVANLLALELTDHGVPNTNVYDYNFACPDVAGDHASQWNPNGDHNNMFNLGNCNDQVTYVPGRLYDTIRVFTLWTTQWGKYGQNYWFIPKNQPNPMNILANHDAALYEDYFAEKRPFNALKTFDQVDAYCQAAKKIAFAWQCPVDTKVYNSAGDLVAEVKDNKPIYYDDENVFIIVNGDEKYIIVPAGENYRTEATATDNGEMTFTTFESNLVTGDVESEKQFKSVELTEGKRFTGVVEQATEPTDAKLYVVDATSGVPTQEVREDGTEVAATDVAADMYRMYNSWTGEHLYTASATERDTMRGNGWDYEGVMWSAPKTSFNPVWRLYNPYSGDHHYARTRNEYDSLQQQGWQGEGVAFYSAGTDGVPIYRLFNPYQESVGTHNYTDSAPERDANVSQGWRYEEVGWYGMR